MSDNSDDMQDDEGEDNSLSLQVVNAGTVITSHIINRLSRYAVEMISAGITGIIMEIEKTGTTIRFIRRESQSVYPIKIREHLAAKFSQAINSIEKNPAIRSNIKQATIQELENDLFDIFLQIREEMNRNRF